MNIRGTIGDRAGLGALKQALHAYALRHRVIAGNIANAETPGYQPRRVTFEEAARRAMGGSTGVEGAVTHSSHMPVGAGPLNPMHPEVVEQTPSGEETGVDLQREMVDLVENQLSYRLAVRLLDMKYNQLQAAIRGTGR